MEGFATAEEARHDQTGKRHQKRHRSANFRSRAACLRTIPV
jgi:hypothetical protein